MSREEYNKQWYLKNKERRQEYKKQWYLKNKEREVLKRKQYYQKNKVAQNIKTMARYQRIKDTPEYKEQGKQYRERNKGRIKAYHIKRNYAISLEEYAKLDKKQNGVCAICHINEQQVNTMNGRVQKLSVDHNHNTGKVRGLLCNACNMGLGNFRDNPQALRAAADYLDSTSL